MKILRRKSKEEAKITRNYMKEFLEIVAEILNVEETCNAYEFKFDETEVNKEAEVCIGYYKFDKRPAIRRRTLKFKTTPVETVAIKEAMDDIFGIDTESSILFEAEVDSVTIIEEREVDEK